jgi:hypothetical protein
MSNDFFSNDTELFSGLLGSSSNSGQKRTHRDETNNDNDIDPPQKRQKSEK